MRIILLALVTLCACGDSNSIRVDAPRQADAPSSDAPTVDAGIDAGIDAADPRGPAVFDLAGGANGLLWDDATSTLYYTDGNANMLIKWTDAGGAQPVGTFPVVTAGVSLGDMVMRSGGTVLITNFGFGTEGSLFRMASDGTASSLTGLDPTRKRIGFGQDPAGIMYDAYFTGPGSNPVGGVSSVVLGGGGTVGTETEIAGATTTAGFKKLVGLVATATNVYVADQTMLTIYQITVPGFAVTPLATVPSADLLTMMPNGDLLTGGTGVHRITQAGAVTTIITGVESVRGMAYDPTLRRLFFIEHSATPGTPDKLHVRPLDN